MERLNQYTYCVNNHLKYIDPDGHDYFDPEWSRHDAGDIPGYSLKAAFRALSLWLHNAITKAMSKWGGWIVDNRKNSNDVGVGTGAAGTILTMAAGMGGYASLGAGLVFGFMYNELSDSAEFYNEMWENDPQYRELLATAEYYVRLLEAGVDCDQEVFDAMLELYVYMLQARYGDDWRAYAPPNVCMAYDMMMERKRESQDNEEDVQLVDSPGESHGSLPGKEPV